MLLTHCFTEHTTCDEPGDLAESLQDPGLNYASDYARRLVSEIVDSLLCD